MKLKFTPDSAGNLTESFGPEDVFHYIYAVLHSPEYRARYADFLKSHFPRVSVTSSRPLFASLVELGKLLASMHLMKLTGSDFPSFPEVGTNKVVKVAYTPPTKERPGRVYINGQQYFEGVTLKMWEFTIGGYHPAEKWLKDRVRRILSFEDIQHYQRISSILAETPKVMAQIDEAIELHGGWPLQ